MHAIAPEYQVPQTLDNECLGPQIPELYTCPLAMTSDPANALGAAIAAASVVATIADKSDPTQARTRLMFYSFSSIKRWTRYDHA